MAAERDIGAFVSTGLRLTQREDVGVGLGTLSVHATGNTYIGSEVDINLLGIDTEAETYG